MPQTARLLVFLLLFCAALPAARANTYAVTTGSMPGAAANYIKNGDVINLLTDGTIGGPSGATAALINFNATGGPTSFTIQSGDGAWHTLTNLKSNPSTGPVLGPMAGSSTITLVNVILAGNHPTAAGGAINYAAGSALVTDTSAITGTAIFQNNSSGATGGAINSAGVAVVLLSGSFDFDGNTAGTNGGAVNIVGGNLILSGTDTFQNNNAKALGGALNIGASAQNLIVQGDNLFASNTAGTNGGAINLQVNTAGTIYITGLARFLHNSATGNGGAISDVPGTANTNFISITGTTLFTSNTAGGNGGAINAAGLGITILGSSTFLNNTAGGNGGAINAPTLGSTVTLDASLGDIYFKGNTSSTGTDFSQSGTRNSIALFSGSTAGGGQTTLLLATGSASGAHTIYFYDPIAGSNTTAFGPDQVCANITQTGNGTVLYDTYQSTVNGTTTIQSGTMLLSNNAAYTNSSTTGYYELQAPATLAATTGSSTVQAATLALDTGAQLNATTNATLALAATTLATPAINFAGPGTLDLSQIATFAAPLQIKATGTIAGQPLTASLVTIGAPGHTTPQTLTLDPTAPLTITDGGTLAFNLYTGGAADLLNLGTLTLTGSAFISVTGGASGSYELINASTDISALAPSLISLAGDGTLTFQNGGTQLWFNLTIANTITRWTGAAPGAIWASSLSTNQNWDNAAGVLTFVNGDTVLFDDTATNKTVTIDPVGVSPAGITVNNTAGNDYTLAGTGAITATGTLVKQGAGSLNFTNTATNTFAAGIEISAGTITFTNPAQLGDNGNGIHATGNSTLLSAAPNLTLANTLIIDPATTLTLDTRANTLTYAGTLAPDATSTLAKTGSGTLILAAGNSANTATTRVQQGTLALATAATLGGAINLDSGATLAGSGTATGAVNAAPGATIAPGALSPAAPVTLTINTLNLDSTILSFDLFANGANDHLNLTGPLTLAGSSTINISTFQIGTYDLGANLAALAAAGRATVTIGGFAQAPGARQTATLTAGGAGGADLILTAGADISRILTWTGATTTTWNPNDINWTATGTAILYADGDRAILDDTAGGAPAANHAITIAGAGIKVSDMIVNTADTYTITGAGITADPASLIAGTVIQTATGALLKQGTGTLALNNAPNTFLGGINLQAGAITYTDAAQLGTGTAAGAAGAAGAAITFAGNALLANAATTNQTLANNITAATGVTGTLDTGATTLTLAGALSGAGTLAKTGTGVLALAGASPDAANLTLAITQGALLLNTATYAGAIDTAPATLVTATGANTIGQLDLAATSTLAGTGTIAGAATLAGLVTTAIAPGGTLAITATTTGPGAWLKTGAGTLELSGQAGGAALGNTGATQLNAGALRITGVSGTDATTGANIASTIAQNILLNGGTLALTGTGAPASDNVANNWTSLNLIQGANAASSAITGLNDLVTIGSGTFAPALLSALVVDINPGAGAATVLSNTANNFTGVVRIDSGTLQVLTPQGLGTMTGSGTKVILNGGALRISATITGTNRAIEMRSDATITVDDGLSIQWNAINHSGTPAGTLTKNGAGTLIDNTNLQATTLVVDAGRYIANAGQGLPANSGTIVINENATVQLSPTVATYTNATLGLAAGRAILPTTNCNLANPIVGSGTFALTSGTAALISPITDIAHITVAGTATILALASNATVMDLATRPGSSITVSQGATLVLGAASHNLGDLTLADGSTLAFLKTGTFANGVFTSAGQGFKTATIKSLTATGAGAPAIYFNTNLALGLADHLNITTPVTGAYTIGINNYGSLPAQATAAVQLIKAPQASTATFTPASPTFDIGLYQYTVNTSNAGGATTVNITGTGAMSQSASIINATAAMLPVSWFTELDTLTQRLGELRLDTAGAGNRVNTWVRGYGNRVNYNAKVAGTPFNENQYGGEAGGDCVFATADLDCRVGAYMGYGQSQRDTGPAGSASNESVFGGLYQTIRAKTGWYADGVLKANSFNNRFTTTAAAGATATAAYHNWAIGASLEFGKYCDLPYGWFIEPQIQAAFTIISGKTYATGDGGITVEMRPGATTQARAGFLFGRAIETAAHGTLNAYIKAYGAEQWTTDAQLYATTADGQSARYVTAIKGGSITGGAGVAWQFAKSTQLYLDYETTQAQYYIEPWAFNLGLRHNW